MTLLWIIALSLVAGLGTAISYGGFRRDRFGWVLIALVGVASAFLVFDVVAVSTGFHDADGITDCWPYCSSLQNFVKATLFGASLLWLVVILVAMLRGWRGRRS